MTEEALDARDERLANQFLKTIRSLRETARELRETAAVSEALARKIEQAIKDEHWWKLEDLLDDDDLESLCESSPVDLLGSA